MDVSVNLEVESDVDCSDDNLARGNFKTISSNTSREEKETKRQLHDSDKKEEIDYWQDAFQLLDEPATNSRDKNSSRKHNSSSSFAGSKLPYSLNQESGAVIVDSHTDSISPEFDHTKVFAGLQKSRSSSSSTRGDGNSSTRIAAAAAAATKNSISGSTKDCWLDHPANNHTIRDRKANACYRFHSTTYVTMHSSST